MTIKNVFHTVKKLDIFQRGKPMILVKNLNFLDCVFLFKKGPDIMFGDVLKKKEGVLHNKYVLCSRKMGYFPKGLTHDFGQKIELSSLFISIKNRR